MSVSSDMRLQVTLQAIDKATAPLRRIKETSGDAARALKETRDKLKELNSAQATVRGYRVATVEIRQNAQALKQLQSKGQIYKEQLERHQTSHDALTAKLKLAKSEYNKLSKALITGKGSSEQFSQTLLAARVRLDAAQTSVKHSTTRFKWLSLQIGKSEADFKKLTAQQTATQEKLAGYKAKLDAAGIGTEHLGRKTRELRAGQEQLNASIDRQKAKLEALGAKEKQLADLRSKHGKAMMRTAMIGGAGYAAYSVGKRAMQTILNPVSAFAAHEDAMLGIARQVPGARNELGTLTPVYREIEEQIRQLSHEIPLATTEIAEMVTAAARMEVPTEQLKDFTRTAAMMATAFDAVPDEITDAMGKVAKNYKMPVTQIEGLADSINYLDDNASSKGKDIIDFLNRTSGVIAGVAMSAKDAAALGSTLLTLGERPETASTAANAIVQKFAAATKGTKKFKAAMAEIGLSTQEVQKGMSQDATGTLMKVIEAVRKLPKDKQIGVMVELVGMEHSDTLAKLVDKPEELKRQMQLANGKEASGSMRREASARNATTSAQWQMSQNRLFNAKAQLGETLKPAIIELMGVVNPMLEKFTAWIKVHPQLVAGIMKVAAGFALLVAGVGALLVPIALVVGKLLLLRFGMQMIGLKSGLTATAFKSVGNSAVWMAKRTLLAGRLMGGALNTPGRSAIQLGRTFVGHLGTGAQFVTRGSLQLVKTLRGQLVNAVMMVGRVFMVAGRALMLNPIGLAITAIAASALLIYKYWAPIKAFLGGVFDGFMSALQPLADMVGPALDGIRAALAPLQPVFNMLRPCWDWFVGILGKAWGWVKQLFAPFQATQEQLKGAASAGQSFGQMLGNLLVFAATLPLRLFTLGADMIRGLVNGFLSLNGMIGAAIGQLWGVIRDGFNQGMAWLTSLPARFGELGGAIMQGLANGVTNALGAVKDAIKGAADSTLGWFKEKLPSRLFTVAGGQINQGAAAGITQSKGVVQGAAEGTANSALAAFQQKLRIKSPSRVFMAAGGEISNGAAEGITRRQSLVRQAALGMAAAAAVTLPPAVHAAMPRMPDIAPGIELPAPPVIAPTLAMPRMPDIAPGIQLPTLPAIAPTLTMPRMPDIAPGIRLPVPPVIAPTVAMPRMPDIAPGIRLPALPAIAPMLTMPRIPDIAPGIQLPALPVIAPMLAMPRVPDIAPGIRLPALPAIAPTLTMPRMPDIAPGIRLPTPPVFVPPIDMPRLPDMRAGIPRSTPPFVAPALARASTAAADLPRIATESTGPGIRIDNGPPVRAPRTASPTRSAGDTYTFHIHAAPGMDPQAIARAVRAELDRRQHAKGAAQRSSLSDID